MIVYDQYLWVSLFPPFDKRGNASQTLNFIGFGKYFHKKGKKLIP